MNAPDPRSEYLSRLEARQAASARLASRHIRIGNLRVAVAALFIGLIWVSPWWTLAPAAFFVYLIVVHEQVRRNLTRANRAAASYEKGIARFDDRWAGKGETGDRFHDTKHPYAEDLDLFGTGGLFELLSTARTRMGEEKLAGWLLSPAPPEIIRERQRAVTDLRGRLDLREDLAVLGEDVRVGVHPDALLRWSEEAPALVSRAARIAAPTLAAAAVGTAALWAWSGLLAPFAAVLAVEVAFSFAIRKKVGHVVHGVEEASHDLSLLSAVLYRLEREQFESPLLVRLRATLDTEGAAPSRQIARLNWLLHLLDSRDHLVLRIFGPPLLYTTQLAFMVEAWRKTCGPHVRLWLDTVGEMEGLSAIAGYAYEHPADPFPDFSETSPLFDGEALGHPLLPEARSVRNDVRLGGGEVRVLIVSGSNMSGKSSLLRTVGINTVLAMAGAPVRARRLRLSPLSVGASIRVTDSLQDGTSRFYGEIKRLRKMVDLAAGPYPLLFLLDELLHGTNSHDRRIGAEAVVRGLVERGAIGLITTHDLALAHIADTLAPAGSNVHFEDHLEDGRIRFDYLLRPGVVHKSNALELMRSIGLEV